MTLLETAQGYLSLGWSVIPVKPGSKLPAVTWKEYQTRPATQDELSSWFKDKTVNEIGIGLVTGKLSKIVVVDLDLYKEASDGKQILDTLIKVRTGGGGLHGYYAWNREIKNQVNINGKAIDVRGDGGYVVLPPTVHPNGTSYRWIIDRGLRISEALLGLPCLPEELGWWIEVTEPLRIEEIVGTKEGERDIQLYRAACKLLRTNKQGEDVYPQLLALNDTFQPPLPEKTVKEKLSSAQKFVLPQIEAERTENSEDRFNRSDHGNALIIEKLFGDKIRYDHRKERWLLWKEHRWVPDDLEAMRELAVEAAQWRFGRAWDIEGDKTKEAGFAIRSENRSMVEGALGLLKSLGSIADDGKNWDQDPLLLSVENGIVDLRTGELRRGRPEDRITMIANVKYDPEADCSRWDKFIDEVFESDKELIAFVQKALGYSLTGSEKSQAAFFCYGSGANGKSVLFKTIKNILGDYAWDAPASLFEKNSQATNTNDVAATERVRFLVSSENLTTSRLHEQRIKAWTGGDTVTARFLNREFFRFEPTAKPWLFFNHKPQVSDDSNGFWRRIRLIPFNKVFEEDKQDLELTIKLSREADGILNWLLAGCLTWQREGLNPVPEKIKTATQTYREENDALAEFVDEECIESGEVRARELYQAYIKWSTAQGLSVKEILTSTAFGVRMGDKFSKIHKETGWIYDGVSLKDKTADGLAEILGTADGLDPDLPF